MAGQNITFGPFSFDAARGMLLRDGVPLPVGQRAASLLTALLDADGETLGKDELMARAWPGAVVEEANLTVQIAALRKAMGTTADGDDWILTIPRVGYRLPLPPPSNPLPATRGLASVAVLPFSNHSSDPEQDYFADGITEDLITALSRFHGFSVMSRGSSFALRGKSLDAREAGKLMGARYLLGGSVRRSGETVRVSAELADATTGEELWAERFDGTRGDIFSMQDRITETVIGLVQPHIQKGEIERARRERPENLDAYDLYLRALPLVHGSDPAGYEVALGLLQRAVALEPGYAIALAYAAWCYEKRITLNMPPLGPGDRAEMTRLARLALSLAGDDPRVLVICGFVLMSVGNDRTGLEAVRRARAANPNDLIVLNLAGYAEGLSDNFDTSRAHFARALALSTTNAPEDYQNFTGLAAVCVGEGKFEEALEWGRRSLATFNDWPVTYWLLAAAAAHLGRMDEAREYAGRLRTLAPTFSIAHALSERFNNDSASWSAIADGLRQAGLPDT